MWAIRRTCNNYLKAQGLNIANFRACAGVGPFSIPTEDKAVVSELRLLTVNRWITSTTCICTVPVAKLFLVGYRCLSSNAGYKSGGEGFDQVCFGLSDLEPPDEIFDDDTENSSSDSGLSSIGASLEKKKDAGKTASKKKYAPSALLKLIMDLSIKSIPGALDKYFEGKKLSRAEVYDLLFNLRRRKFYGKALQVSHWLEQRHDFEFSERDYATRVDLIAKERGLQQAESYMESIPISFREEVVHRTLLANFVIASLVDKSEQLFNKMKDLGFPITLYTCNQMLILYMRGDQRKISDVISLMQKENLKPSLFTYSVLIDARGKSNDIQGMEQIVETMKSEGVEPDNSVEAILARHYVAAGLTEKAEAVLKEMEEKYLKRQSTLSICPLLLPIYADLGKPEEVKRIWKIMESKPRQANFFAAISAWAKLKNIEQAESIFNEMIKTYKNLSANHYTIMLKVYAENKMLSKGKELLKQMTDNGCFIGPRAWDLLVKLYVNVGEIEHAVLVLQRAGQENQKPRPLFNSYMTILQEYSKRGDVHNAEKVFHMMRRAGYIVGAKPYQTLLQTYINAKRPAYGIRDRMMVDKLQLNKGLLVQLNHVDAFEKVSVKAGLKSSFV